jgi:anti-sigma B factor antagonist
MQIAHRVVGDDVVVIEVMGAITSAEGGCGDLKEKIQTLLQQGHRKLLLDLSKTSFIDSAGLAQLVQTYTMTSSMGGSLKMVNLTRRLKDLLALTKLLSVFDRSDPDV